ncbi:hypothetical protein [Pelagimonas varians]|uniref:Uncharacterized protein n=1 Tax=Pelagimonas varians TaxID=696760 RepID=A0A238KJB2_9RHOB|nr:hypothetical protein [Pelagimonas varians]PYG29543.1 hypothetical protein C8N36_10893 [Pelagimonas varians]SMX42851.1 hypothetical protein PEV8663_02497 [Pelagimonas varians]
MRSGLNILNIGLMAVLLVAAVSVHALGVAPTVEPINPSSIPPVFFQQ